ncbi:MAG TPA: desulfoferrodoxin [Nautiliaceae bacterium]|nr:desulfoferrodoxin [Nautiliaceae bacterium]
MKFGDTIYNEENINESVKIKSESHTPRIEVPEKVKKGEKVTIKVRVGPHPNEVNHSIKKIELWFYEKDRVFNPIHLSTVELEPGYGEPELEIKVKLSKSGIIYALSYCNLHGYWEARKEIIVEE